MQSRLKSREAVVLQHVEKSLQDRTSGRTFSEIDTTNAAKRWKWSDGKGRKGRTVFPALSNPRNRILAFYLP